MSQIDDLIRELCPGGVQHKTLDELLKAIPRGRRLTKSALPEGGSIPVFHGGLEPIGFSDNANTPAQTVMIINVGASAGSVGWSEDAFWCSDGCFALPHTPLVLSRYLYYSALANQRFFVGKVRRAGIPTLAAASVLSLSIPVPPIEIQKEIVKILDTFIDLEAELEAELEVRETQYEVVRGSLVSFDGDLEGHPLAEMIKHLCPEGVGFAKLSEVTVLNAGDRVTKANMSPNGIYPVFGAGSIPTGRLDQWNHEQGLTISRAGAGAGFVNFIEAKFWATDVCFVARQNQDGPMIKFVYYWMKSSERELMKKTYGGSLPKIDKHYLWAHPVPIPPLAIQHEIVRILDSFDSLVNDLSSGLPAEIAARRKQYEYYRDKLLTFEELAA